MNADFYEALLYEGYLNYLMDDEEPNKKQVNEEQNKTEEEDFIWV